MVVTVAENPLISRRLLYLLFLLLFLLPSLAQASKTVDTQSIAQIYKDEEGGELTYPAGVFFDPQQEELYVVNGGNGRVVVYGADYFPRWSIGSGRGVLTPRSGRVLADGRVVIVQINNRLNPVPRITILNGAFFPEQDIPLDKIPGVENFTPHNVAFGRDGLMYVSGELYRGILVLDQEGFYLRTLQPTDAVSMLAQDYKKDHPDEAGAAAETDAKPAAEEEYADIPEEFRPRDLPGVRISSGGKDAVGPVRLNYVQIDSKGRIYMISPETGKIYVYDAEERFLFSFGTKGGSPGQLSNPRSLAIDEERGVLYVADYMRHSILGYTLQGEYLFDTGGRGFAPGWFNFPNDIALNSRGELIVADLFNKRVQVLNVNIEERYFDLEDLVKTDSAAEPSAAETSDDKETVDAGEGGAPFELVPGTPDIDYEQTGDASSVAPEAGPEANAEPAEKVEIEVLQGGDIPAVSK